MSACSCPACFVALLLLLQHTDYHQQLGFSGAILLVTRAVAAELLSQPAMQPGLKAGAYFIILWVSVEGGGLPAQLVRFPVCLLSWNQAC